MKINNTIGSSSSWTQRMKSANPRVVCDIIETASYFSESDLKRVRDIAIHQPELFSRGVYQHSSIPGAGCLLWHLSEGQITSKKELTFFFTGRSDDEARELPSYQAPRYVVRAFDRSLENERYGSCEMISLELIIETLSFVLTPGKDILSPVKAEA